MRLHLRSTMLASLSSAGFLLPQEVSGTYANRVTLSSSMTFSYKLDFVDKNGQLLVGPASPPPSSANALSICMDYNGLGFVAFGISKSGNMVPSQAVVGLPGSSNIPEKYDISAYSTRGVNPMDRSQQTLINATITQDTGTHTTTLCFTKLMEETGETSIQGPGNTNNFIWAAGTSNTLGFHGGGYGNFQVNLDGSLTSSSPATGASEATTNYPRMFMIHGILAAVGWALLTPLAIAASLLRNLLPPGKYWLWIHLSFNLTTVVLTAVAVCLAAYFIYQQDGSLSIMEDKHFLTGWIIAILVLIQAGFGLFRPHPASPPQPTTSQVDQPTDSEQGAVTGQHQQQEQQKIQRSPIRKIWEVKHRLFGYGILAVSLWQCYTGLVLYGNNYGNNWGGHYITIYFGWLLALGITIILLKMFSLVQAGFFRSCRKKDGSVVELGNATTSSSPASS